MVKHNHLISRILGASKAARLFTMTSMSLLDQQSSCLDPPSTDRTPHTYPPSRVTLTSISPKLWTLFTTRQRSNEGCIVASWEVRPVFWSRIPYRLSRYDI